MPLAVGREAQRIAALLLTPGHCLGIARAGAGNDKLPCQRAPA